MTGSIISYKQNEVRLTAINFITGAFLYLYLVGEIIGGENIFSSHDKTVSAVLLAGEAVFCAGSLIVAFYQRRYNRLLAETGAGINRWFLSERTFNYLTAIVMFLIGWYLVTMPLTESRSGLATGGLFFDNHRFADAPQTFESLLYFHFTICVVPLVCAAWLLIFPPKNINR